MSAIWWACIKGDAALLRRLRPDPTIDDFDDLYGCARNDPVIRELARHALPGKMGRVIQRQLWSLPTDIGREREWESIGKLRTLFEVGARWTISSDEETAIVRRSLLKVSNNAFAKLMQLFAEGEHCSQEILQEIGRAPAFRKRMQDVGFIRGLPSGSRSARITPRGGRSVREKFAVASEPQRLPHTIEIGRGRKFNREIRLDRAMLFERVWADSADRVAAEWGISGNALAKVCKRIQIPLPPRGYFAKVAAGQRVKRPRLPSLPAGQAERIMVYLPET